MSENWKGVRDGYLIAVSFLAIFMAFVTQRQQKEIDSFTSKFLALQQLQVHVLDHEKRLNEIEPTAYAEIHRLQLQVGSLMEDGK